MDNHNIVCKKMNLLHSLDPDYIQCDVCKKWFLKKIIQIFETLLYPNEIICPACAIQEDKDREKVESNLSKKINKFNEQMHKNHLI